MAQAKHSTTPAQINRRALIGAIPAFGFSLAAVQAGAEPVTPVMALFREWVDAKAALLAISDDDPLHSDTGKRWMEIEARLENAPAQTMQDVAAKIIATTNYGQDDLPSNDGESLMWREILALVA